MSKTLRVGTIVLICLIGLLLSGLVYYKIAKKSQAGDPQALADAKKAPEIDLTKVGIPVPGIKYFEEHTYTDVDGSTYFLRKYYGDPLDELYFLNGSKFEKVAGFPKNIVSISVYKGYPGIYAHVGYAYNDENPLLFFKLNKSQASPVESLNSISKISNLESAQGFFPTSQGIYLTYTGFDLNNLNTKHPTDLFRLEGDKLNKFKTFQFTRSIGEGMFSNDKGDVYANFDGDLFRIEGKQLIPVSGGGYTIPKTPDAQFGFGADFKYIGNTWYLFTGNEFSNKKELFRVNNTDLIPITGLNGFSYNLSIATTSTYIYAHRYIAGFCGDDRCRATYLYILKGDGASPLIGGNPLSNSIYNINGDINPNNDNTVYLDKRRNFYAFIDKTLFIIKDGNTVGKISNLVPNTFDSISMFSDEKNTYIAIPTSHSAAVLSNNPAKEIYKLEI